ncbi:MAG: hypothetical protein KGJ93_00400 [Patescibacteria group bacterium]|nr:hypothetical protein [Patescibacteria group bacterium]
MKRAFNKLKIFAAAGLAAIIFFLPVLQPVAQAGFIPGVPDPVYLLDPATTGTLTAIAGSTAASATLLGTIQASVGVPGVTSALVSGLLSGAGSVCSNVSQLQEIAGTADTFSSFSLIGGSAAEATQITSKIASLIALRACDNAQLEILKKAPAGSLLAAQELTRRMNALSSEMNSLDQRIEALKARQSASFKDVLRAIAVKLLLTYSQQLTTKLVNSLIAKYKISNYLKYADALSTIIYTSDYVKKNYPGSADQMILRSILLSQPVQGQVLPLVREQAKQNLGFIPDQLAFSDPNYYVKMAQIGFGKNDPYFLTTTFNGQAAEAKAQGDLMAQQEVSQSKGFLPVRDCNGAVNQQQTMDQNYAQLANQYDFNYDVQQKLAAAYKLNPTDATKAQLDQATTAMQTSIDRLTSFPKQVSTPILDLCAGITNPGAFVGDSLTGYLQKQIDQSMNLNNANLPFYGQFIMGVATNFLNNIIQGNKNNLQLLTETGIQAGNVAANSAVQQWSDSKAQGQVSSSIANDQNTLADASSGNIGFKAAKTSVSSQFMILWDASQNSDVGFVTLTGSGLPQASATQARQVTGSLTFSFGQAASAIYTLNLYSKGNIPGQDQPFQQLMITVRNPASGSVAGAFTALAPLQLRGPVPALHLRGE